MKKRHPSANLDVFMLILFFSLLKITLSKSTPRELTRGFDATPDPGADKFQPVLTDIGGAFSLGFLRVNDTQLAVAVIHAASGETLWQANPTAPPPWSKHTHLIFNGSLILLHSPSTVSWSTLTNGDFIVLLNTSDLQVHQKLGDSTSSILWQSFDHPTDTLVPNQNFTINSTLVSSSGLYSMKIGWNFLGLYTRNDMYWKHTALEARARIEPGQGPVYARVNSEGYLGMYQREDSPVEVTPFDTFQRNLSGLTRVRIEPNGNLKAYFWTGSVWSVIYQGIQDPCQLPDACGPYSLCFPSGGCSLLDNGTHHSEDSGDICGGDGIAAGGEFSILRRTGVELPYKELRGFERMKDLGDCEGSCARNCSCWGAVYNNASGFCYMVDYPARTMVSVGDEGKSGYFKMRPIGKRDAGIRVGLALLGGVVGLVVLILGFLVWRIWWKRKIFEGHLGEGDGVCPGSYNELKASSFRSLEMSNR